MTILELKEGQAYCVWFQGSELRNAMFDVAALQWFEAADRRGGQDHAGEAG